MPKILLFLLFLTSTLSAQTFVYSGTRKDYTISTDSGAYTSNSKILAVSDNGTNVTLIYYGRAGTYKYYGIMETSGTLRTIQTPDGRYHAVYSQAYSDETMDYGLHLRGPYSSLTLADSVFTFPRSLIGTERFAGTGLSIETSYALTFDRRRSSDALLSGSSAAAVRDAFVAFLRTQGYSAL
jgi:hypothetical protein